MLVYLKFSIASLADVPNSMHFFSRESLLLVRLHYLGIPRRTPFGRYMIALFSSGMAVSVCATTDA